MGFLHCSICPPYVEMKKLRNTSLVPIQWAKPHDATKMPQLLCVKLEDLKNFTSQALRRSRAVIHLVPGAVKKCRLSPKNRLLRMRGHSAGLSVNWAAKWSGDLGQSRQGRELRLRPAVYPRGGRSLVPTSLATPNVTSRLGRPRAFRC